jgi:hypothetical protein
MIDRPVTGDDSATIVGEPDPRNALILNTYIDGQRLIGLAQPTEWTAAGMKTASNALQVCLQSLQATRYMVDMSDAQRLVRAIGEANDAVRSENRMRAGHDHTQAIGVGVALVVRREKTASIALMPPAELVLLQGPTVRWIPELESWLGKQNGLDGAPLGWSAVPKPTILKTQTDPSDEIAAVSQALAEGLALRRSMVTNSETLTQALCDLGEASATGCDDMVAIVTRIEPNSISRSVRSLPGTLLGGTDRRARAVWAALRQGAEPQSGNEKPQISD